MTPKGAYSRVRHILQNYFKGGGLLEGEAPAMTYGKCLLNTHIQKYLSYIPV